MITLMALPSVALFLSTTAREYTLCKVCVLSILRLACSYLDIYQTFLCTHPDPELLLSGVFVSPFCASCINVLTHFASIDNSIDVFFKIAEALGLGGK